MRWRPTIKWRLMMTTLPIVAAAVALKLILELGVGYYGSVDFADISAVLTAVAFLIGFMLAGTMSDYKEAEKIPGELACTLESIGDAITTASRRKGLDPLHARRVLQATTIALVDYIAQKKTLDDVLAAIDGVDTIVEELDAAGAVPYAVRVQSDVTTLRRLVTRVETIMGTGFLAPGYALLDVMVSATVALLMVSKFKALISEYVLITFITLVYVYMVRLIRDIDNPFERDALGAAEVDPAPLLAYRDRMQARLEERSVAKIASA